MSVTDSVAISGQRVPEHHIPAELLLDYAGGTLAEAASLAVACHLTLCPHCRRDLAAIEGVAGSLVDQMAPQPSAGFEAIAGRLGEQEPAPAVRTAPAKTSVMLLPQPLLDYLPRNLSGDLDAISWRWSGAGLQSYALPVSKSRGGLASLLKIAPGAGLPLHTHGGNELTLVLSGGFTDETGAFQRGDLEVADGDVEHRPVAMLDQPCICLAITDAPLKFSGPLGWFFNQWAKLSA